MLEPFSLVKTNYVDYNCTDQTTSRGQCRFSLQEYYSAFQLDLLEVVLAL